LNEQAFAAATKEYYRQMGWDENGVPTQERLGELGVDSLVKN
jgi:aldehyde:ferredoxin oxidoreductase